ncbi:putative RNA pseudouridine synthase [Porphyridium purpureum]|uniref:Pseudouridine synthase n=1 Tax=Porphyridium purpureum TaxID=35688 RepID=A0A5J4YQR4_PORPP|nr:putative RNA pseudouridine synthase [Porphyridium purpureum]|eukprot:POR8479..scf296_7
MTAARCGSMLHMNALSRGMVAFAAVHVQSRAPHTWQRLDRAAVASAYRARTIVVRRTAHLSVPGSDGNTPDAEERPHSPSSLSLSSPTSLLSSSSSTVEVEAGKADEGVRVDKFLASKLPDRSRNYFIKLIESGAVTRKDVANGANRPLKKNEKVHSGDVLLCSLVTLPSEGVLVPENIPLDIVYEDEYLLAINKPAGMVVHPAPGNWTGTLVNALAFHYKEVLALLDDSLEETVLSEARPGIVHRLDKDTTGIMLVARDGVSLARLQAAFANRLTRKSYLAITYGNPLPEGCSQRLIDEPIGRSTRDHRRMVVAGSEAGNSKASRWARSIVRLIGSSADNKLHLVQVGIETGRTHQIRVHLQHVKTPIVGDDFYSVRGLPNRFPHITRPMLHAFSIAVPHPMTSETLIARAAIPDDMVKVIEAHIFPDFGKEPMKYFKDEFKSGLWVQSPALKSK